MFARYAQRYQALSVPAAAFHEQFVQAVSTGAAGPAATVEPVEQQRSLMRMRPDPAATSVRLVGQLGLAVPAAMLG